MAGAGGLAAASKCATTLDQFRGDQRTQPPYVLPCVLNVVCVEANQALCKLVERALDGLDVALERRLAPPMVARVVGDLDKQPARGHAKVLNRLDGCHDGGGCVSEKRAVVGVQVLSLAADVGDGSVFRLSLLTRYPSFFADSPQFVGVVRGAPQTGFHCGQWVDRWAASWISGDNCSVVYCFSETSQCSYKVKF